MANNMRIGVKLENFHELRALLGELPGAVGANVMGTAIGDAARPIERLAGLKAPKRFGALARSITHVVKKYPGSRIPAIAIVGPDKDFMVPRAGRNRNLRGVDRPSKYAHLVEFGHLTVPGTNIDTPEFFRSGEKRRAVTVRGGKARTVVTFVPAQPFLRPAATAGAGAAAGAFERGVIKGLERETKRLNKKHIKQGRSAA